MTEFTTDALTNGLSDDRALEFDFGIRAPMRRLVLQLVEKGWRYEDIAMAFHEIATELEQSPKDPSSSRSHS